MATTLVYLSDLAGGVIEALTGVGGFPATDVYDGLVENPRLIDEASGRIQPYAVLWISGGPNLEQPLAGPDGGATARVYVTVAASTPGKTLDAADRARRILDGATLPLSGHQVGVRWEAGYFAPPPRRDPDVKPDRWFVPLIFSALI